MKNWPHKERDLAIANALLSEMALINQGTLPLLESKKDKKTKAPLFRLPNWVVTLARLYRELYTLEESIEIMAKVLDEVMRNFNNLTNEDADLFKKVVLVALRKNTPSLTLH